MTDSDALAAIEPLSVVLSIGDRTIEVRPITVGQLPAFTRAIRPAIPTVQKLFREFSMLAELPEGAGGIIDLDAEDLIEVFGSVDGLIEAVRITVGVEREWLDLQTVDVLLSLAGAAVQVNMDFFFRALVPAAVETIGRVRTAQAPGTSSSSSSPASDSAAAT